MTALTLTPAERRDLRGRAHHLQPVVMVGSDGLTAAVEREVEAALAAHGLIKVRVFADDRELREQLLARLADGLGAAAVQHIGKLLVLWRPPVDRARAADEARGPGPRVVRIVKPSKHPARAPVSRKVKVLGNQRVTAGGLVKRARTRVAASPKKRAAG